MTKQKNESQLLRLPTNMQAAKEEKKGRGCGKIIMWGAVVLVGLGILGMFLPKSPAQIAQTQTAAAVALAASDVPKSPTATSIPATATVTPYPDITMTATIPATFDQEEASLKELPAVISVEHIERTETGYWAMVTTWPKMNKESFAQLIQIQAGHVDIYPFRFAVRIDDGESEPLWWIYDDETFEWSSSKNPPEWVDLSTAVIQSTASPTAQRIAVRNTDTKTYYASSGGTNVRSCPKTSCTAVTKIAAGGSIDSLGEVEGDAVNAGNTVWYHIRYEGEDAYVYSGVVKDTKPVTTITTVNTGNQTSSVVDVPQSLPTAAQFICPSNCDGAVAMGLSAQQAAACGMDRDGDGVACYGD